MKKEYDLAQLKSSKNPYASTLKKTQLNKLPESSIAMRRNKAFTYGGTIGAIVLLVSAWFTGKLSGTDVAFQSSDGEWARSELRFKGTDFEQIATEFELYRARCAPNASLHRTTSAPIWHQWDYWFNDYSQPKWKVAHAIRKHDGDRYPPYGVKHCANEPAQLEQMQAARLRARKWLVDGP